jgi:diacylglycerol kinase (ATP)
MGGREDKLMTGMKKNEPFSIRERRNSFKYAINGILKFFSTEHNSWLHVLATIVTFILALVLQVSKLEIVALVIVIGLVWIAELFNTAIEKIMNFITIKQDPRIRYIKDVSAAAVLVSAIVAFITGCIVFIPKLL